MPELLHERGKGMIIAVNKWDAIEKDTHTANEYTERIRQVLSFVPYAEIVYISAKTAQRLNRLFLLLESVIQNHSLRVGTGVLNEILGRSRCNEAAAFGQGKKIKTLLYYTGCCKASYICNIY